MSYESLHNKNNLRKQKAEATYIRQTNQILKESLDDTRQKIAKIYERYARDGVLTAADLARYGRLASLEKSILGAYKPALNETKKILDRSRLDEYAKSYLYEAYAFDKGLGVALDWGLLDKNAIRASLDTVFYEESLAQYGYRNLSRMRTAISHGLAIGQSYPEMMRDLRDATTMAAKDMMRFLRTELHAAQEAGTAKAYDDALASGVRGHVEWVATLDERTRDTHGDMDGAVKDTETGLYDGPGTEKAAYPGDPAIDVSERINCRCTEIIVIDGLEPELRRSRDEGVTEYKNYDEWLKDQNV